MMIVFAVPALLAPGCGDGYVAASGTVRDESGSPVLGATVTLSADPESGLDVEPYRVMTGRDGQFLTALDFGPFLRKNSFTLRVEKKGFQTNSRRVSGVEGEIAIELKRLDPTKK
jgi:hypothetical protein